MNPFTKTLKTCPHLDCGKQFDATITSHGILFCPHCERSLLLEPIKTLQELKKESDEPEKPRYQSLTFNWKILTKPMYWLVTFIVFLLITLFHLEYLKFPSLNYWVFVVLVAIFIVFTIYTINFKKNNRFSFNQYQKELKAGVDNLREVQNHKINFLDWNGRLIIYAYLAQITGESYLIINGCPCCGSQQVTAFRYLLNLNFRYYEQHSISRPEGVPKSFYDPKTQTYLEELPEFQDMLVCLHCHEHFTWDKTKNSLSKQSFHILLQVIAIFMLLAVCINFGLFIDLFFSRVKDDFHYVFNHGLLGEQSIHFILLIAMKSWLITAVMMFAFCVFDSILDWYMMLVRSSKNANFIKRYRHNAQESDNE